MKKIWIAISLLLLLSILPSTVLAAVPTFYCSYYASSGGNGSYNHPWRCDSDADPDDIVADICNDYDYAILYQIVSNGYYRRVIEGDGDCDIALQCSNMATRRIPASHCLLLLMISGLVVLASPS
jgi:hypothetical protein